MRHGFICLLFCLFFSSVFAQGSRFFEINDDCVQELLYQNKRNGNTSRAFLFKVNRDVRVILEVIDGVETRYRKPNNLQPCDKMNPNENFVKNLNRTRMDFFLVEKGMGRGYKLYKVSNAIYLASNDKYIEYTDKDLNFSYDYRPTDGETNLASPRSKTKVFFDKNISFRCPKQFRFKQTFDPEGNEYEYFTITERVGIVERVQPPAPPLSRQTVIELVRIDGRPVKSYYQDLCNDREDQDLSSPDAPNRPDLKPNPDAEEPWARDGHGRIYRDLNTGYYIDRKTWTLANLEYGGYLYVNGRQYHPNDPNAPNASDGFQANQSDQQAGTKGCDVYYDQSRGVYMDRFSNLPADGTCKNKVYRNGKLIASLNNTNGDCFVYQSPSGLYIDGRTGQPANGACEGKNYTNGRLTAGNASKGSMSGNRHIVKKGETAFAIAKRYGLSIAQLQSWNNLAPSATLYPGMALKVSAPGVSSYNYQLSNNLANNKPKGGGDASIPASYEEYTGTDVAAEGKGQFHMVSSGETLQSIAKDYGTSVDRLRALNNMDEYQIIYPGQNLRVDRKAPGALGYQPADLPDAYEAKSERIVVKPRSPKTKEEEPKTYLVQKGDTLFKIAQKHDLSVNELKQLNQLKGNIILAGQKLRVSK